ncbi:MULTISPECIES: hypothetical protein [Peribacillus]
MTEYYIMEKVDPKKFVLEEVLTSTECIELPLESSTNLTILPI